MKKYLFALAVLVAPLIMWVAVESAGKAYLNWAMQPLAPLIEVVQSSNASGPISDSEISEKYGIDASVLRAESAKRSKWSPYVIGFLLFVFVMFVAIEALWLKRRLKT
ncbi:hypothetical protein [Simiduia agarivorans]|nr:hypothetical protein [Simiduia agarivorans]